MRRTSVAIGLGLIGALFVGAFLQAVAADPCERERSGADTVALLAGVILFGVAAYLLASRWTVRSWVPVLALVSTAVVGYFAILSVGLLVFWVPSCTN
jgi:hypothetical protein